MARQGLKGEDIVLTMTFYDNGALFDPLVINNVVIYDQQIGGTAQATIVPVRQSLGVWTATWSVPDSQVSANYWDQWTYQAVAELSFNVFRSLFIISGNIQLAPGGNTQTLENRIQAIETAINTMAIAINNVPTKKQINSWQVLFQKMLNEIQQDLDTHKAVGH